MPDQTLLCVDDERSVLHALRRLLRNESYRLLTAPSAEEGLELLDQEPVQVVLSDNRMPGMTGPEFLHEVKKRHPDTVRMVLSGYADPYVVLESINKGEVYRFLPKPWNDEELKVAIRQCFEHHDLMQQNRSLLEQVRTQNDQLKQWNESLERIVDERTRTLRFSQEILEKLPLPVVGVSREGTIALVNAEASALLAPIQFIPIGLPMEEFLEPDILDAVGHSFTSRAPMTLNTCTLYDRTFRLHVEPLQNGTSVRGCILLFLKPDVS